MPDRVRGILGRQRMEFIQVQAQTKKGRMTQANGDRYLVQELTGAAGPKGG